MQYLGVLHYYVLCHIICILHYECSYTLCHITLFIPHISARCALAAELGKLDIKRSSFRKVTPYLAHCARLELLVTQEDSGVATVTKLNKTHDLFRGAKVENPEQFKLAVLSSTSTAATPSKEETVSTSAFAQYSAAAADNSNSSSAGGSKKLQMLELFKLTKHLRDVFGTPRGEYGEYLRAHEVYIFIIYACFT